MLYLGADHRGFKLKEKIKDYLRKTGIPFKDMGAFKYNENDDYTDFAYLVAKNIASKPEVDRGIVICGSGIGVSITANKIKDVRAALIWSKKSAKAAIEDDGSNILALPADFITFGLAKQIIEIWFNKGGKKLAARHRRRLEKIKKIENNNF